MKPPEKRPSGSQETRPAITIAQMQSKFRVCPSMIVDTIRRPLFLWEIRRVLFTGQIGSRHDSNQKGTDRDAPFYLPNVQSPDFT